MADTELIRVLDFILNRCDETSIEVLAAAVVRRRRDLAVFGNLKIPDPQRMAKELSAKINSSISSGVQGMKESIRDMAERIIKQEAPELTPGQIEELILTWIPENKTQPGRPGFSKMPKDLWASMIDQFVSFSRGTMSQAEDKQLRDEMGSWPERYWKAFPAHICSIITDYLKDKISESEFNSKIGVALEM